MYETNISDKEWWIYDILGNLGWIVYYIMLALTITQLHTFQGTVPIILSLVELICALGILVGILELISERIARLGKILPKVRLLRGFGCITVSSSIAAIVSFAHFALLCKEGHTNNMYLLLMAMGALFCCIFCGLLLHRYKKIR